MLLGNWGGEWRRWGGVNASGELGRGKAALGRGECFWGIGEGSGGAGKG